MAVVVVVEVLGLELAGVEDGGRGACGWEELEGMFNRRCSAVWAE